MLEPAASAACNFCSSNVAVAKLLPVRLRPAAVIPATNGRHGSALLDGTDNRTAVKRTERLLTLDT